MIKALGLSALLLSVLFASFGASPLPAQAAVEWIDGPPQYDRQAPFPSDLKLALVALEIPRWKNKQQLTEKEKTLCLTAFETVIRSPGLLYMLEVLDAIQFAKFLDLSINLSIEKQHPYEGPNGLEPSVFDRLVPILRHRTPETFDEETRLVVQRIFLKKLIQWWQSQPQQPVPSEAAPNMKTLAQKLTKSPSLEHLNLKGYELLQALTDSLLFHPLSFDFQERPISSNLFSFEQRIALTKALYGTFGPDMPNGGDLSLLLGKALFPFTRTSRLVSEFWEDPNLLSSIATHSPDVFVAMMVDCWNYVLAEGSDRKVVRKILLALQRIVLTPDLSPATREILCRGFAQHFSKVEGRSDKALPLLLGDGEFHGFPMLPPEYRKTGRERLARLIFEDLHAVNWKTRVGIDSPEPIALIRSLLTTAAPSSVYPISLEAKFELLRALRLAPAGKALVQAYEPEIRALLEPVIRAVQAQAPLPLSPELLLEVAQILEKTRLSKAIPGLELLHSGQLALPGALSLAIPGQSQGDLSLTSEEAMGAPDQRAPCESELDPKPQ